MNTEKIVDSLDRLIVGAVPGATRVAKYGGTLYTLAPDEKEGQFCGVFAYDKHVQLSFSRGDLLDDPAGLLAGTGKRRRHINFSDVSHVPEDDVRRFVREASELG